MSTGSARPLEDAFRIAQLDLVEWVAGVYGLDPLDAYQLLSQAVESPLANVCDTNYTSVAKMRKDYLRPAPSRHGAHARLRELAARVPVLGWALGVEGRHLGRGVAVARRPRRPGRRPRSRPGRRRSASGPARPAPRPAGRGAGCRSAGRCPRRARPPRRWPAGPRSPRAARRSPPARRAAPGCAAWLSPGEPGQRARGSPGRQPRGAAVLRQAAGQDAVGGDADARAPARRAGSPPRCRG